MATIRAGAAPVLLVVDVQNGVVAAAYDRDRVVASIGQALAAARGAGVPVLWVRHADAELPSGSEAWRIVGELAVAPGERVIEKSHNSAFEGTGLEDLLAGLGATEIVLAGAASNWCIRATAYAALERGYDLTLVADGHTTESLDLGPSGRIEAKDIVAELNVAMRWLSYPGRRNRAVPVRELGALLAGAGPSAPRPPEIFVEETHEAPPKDLLALSDPSEEVIAEYLDESVVFAARKDGAVVGALVLLRTRPRAMEIMNLAVYEAHQNQGIGRRLILKAVDYARAKGCRTLEIGTGNPGLVQMMLYQKCGFRIVGVEPDYFRKNHDEPIYEDGIECRDMIRLRMEL